MLAAQAVTLDKFGPFSPWFIETMPPSIFTSADGMKNGEILFTPFSKYVIEFFSIFGKPPMPAAELTPNL